MTRMVALLRGINVSGRRKLPMAELKTLCGDLGLRDAVTYIQSGNIVFTAADGETPTAVATRLEMAIDRRFGFAAPAIVRTAAEWARYAAGSPFPEAEDAQANALMLVLGAAPPSPGAADALSERAHAGERITARDDALWVLYTAGVAQSKLTPAMFDRLMGGAATSRNWRTVQRLHLLAQG